MSVLNNLRPILDYIEAFGGLRSPKTSSQQPSESNFFKRMTLYYVCESCLVISIVKLKLHLLKLRLYYKILYLVLRHSSTNGPYK